MRDMMKNLALGFLIFLFLFFPFSISDQQQLVPALYVFGDSIVDAGNNQAKPPCGIDLHDPSLAPRATNGRTIADFIAISLGLPLVPPYNITPNSTTGVNYGFGGSGILPETMDWGWNFDKQIALFKNTIERLYYIFGEDEFNNHFNKSIFLISFGINDFVGYIYAKNTYGHRLEPMLFSKYLLRSLSERLTRLYIMGAKKFVVNNIWPLGCMPVYNSSGLGFCNATINNMVSDYNNSLPLMLHELASELDGFEYSYSNDFAFYNYLNLYPQQTGISNILDSCWDKDSEILCPNRDAYLYFDKVHPTEAANDLFAINCFKGTLCAPQNIMGLVGVGA